MRGMAKLNNLEDMAEPPLHDNIEASPRNQRPQGGNDMEMEAGSGMGALSSFPFSPEDSHPGLEQTASV